MNRQVIGDASRKGGDFASVFTQVFNSPVQGYLCRFFRGDVSGVGEVLFIANCPTIGTVTQPSSLYRSDRIFQPGFLSPSLCVAVTWLTNCRNDFCGMYCTKRLTLVQLVSSPGITLTDLGVPNIISWAK